ncbi:MAG: 4-hydroxy-tetrahydrodipicolinate reductase [Lachnospiraceae bacterium]|jgi:4-hydroxy-tetrahydrodipicolinate reductase|nr:4-hydroxy-tetrahydrodipicolinate reductase [Lachnospiraceae bacterium]
MIKVIMHGCNGRMGQVITRLMEEDPETTIVAGIDPFDEGKNSYPVFGNIAQCDKQADVVVDFSNALAVDGLLEYCVEKKLPVVLCTTGLSENQLQKVKEASERIAVLRSANMSLGVNLLMELVKQAAKVLAGEGFDMEIEEKHHRHKLDAPSGTAIALGDAINEAMGNTYHYEMDRTGKRQERDEKEIGFSAVRGGSIVGDHDVIFAGMDEVVTLSHRAYSRDIFGKGAVAAAKFLAGKKAGMYTMAEVIAQKS